MLHIGKVSQQRQCFSDKTLISLCLLFQMWKPHILSENLNVVFRKYLLLFSIAEMFCYNLSISLLLLMFPLSHFGQRKILPAGAGALSCSHLVVQNIYQVKFEAVHRKNDILQHIKHSKDFKMSESIGTE